MMVKSEEMLNETERSILEVLNEPRFTVRRKYRLIITYDEKLNFSREVLKLFRERIILIEMLKLELSN